MRRSTYLKSVYSRYWLHARESIYGTHSTYDQSLIERIEKRIKIKSRILDVASGTGLPFAKYFSDASHQVSACDLAEILVDAFKKNVPEAEIRMESSDQLSYPSSVFDLCYCFHSTWYFEKFYESLAEMIRVTKTQGWIIFDIQNAMNDEIKKSFDFHRSQNQGFGLLKRYYYNLLILFKTQGKPSWTKVIYETPTNPMDVLAFLKEKGLTTVSVYVRASDDSIEMADLSKIHSYPRILFEIQKNLAGVLFCFCSSL